MESPVGGRNDDADRVRGRDGQPRERQDDSIMPLPLGGDGA
jgi:hypothetical protein